MEYWQKYFRIFPTMAVSRDRVVCSVFRMVLAVVVCDCLLVPGVAVSTTVPLEQFYWNTSNTMFSSPEGAKKEMVLNTKLQFLCPDNVLEFYKIYYVKTKEEFEGCFVQTRNQHNEVVPSRPFLTCDSRNSSRRDFIFTLRNFQPVGYVPNFKVGQNYYFITPSKGDLLGINSTRDGACTYHNMKLNLTIVLASTTTTTQGPSFNTSRTTPSPPWTTRRPTTTRQTTTTTQRSTPSRRTTTRRTTVSIRPSSPDIPIINAGENENSGVIDANGGVRTYHISWALVCLCVVLVHIGQLVTR